MPMSLLLGLILAAPAVDGPLPSDPEFTARRLDGTTWTGRLAHLDRNSGLRIVEESGAERTAGLEELFAITRVEPGPEPTRRRDGALILAGGDVLLGQVTHSNGEVVSLQSQGGAKLEVALDRVEGLVLGSPPSRERRDALIDAIRSDRRDSDVFWLANGDRITGTFVGLEGDRLLLEREGLESELPRSQVTVAFDLALLRPHQPAERAFEVHTRSGGRITGSDVLFDRGLLRVEIDGGPTVDVPIADVERIYARSPAFSFLTDRPIDAQESVPYVGLAQPARIDRAVEGQRLEVGGRVVPRGIGVHARSLLAYRLAPTDRRFQAEAALLDSTNEWGSVIFRVLLDSRPAFESDVVRRGDPPVAIDLDVRGTRVLILIVEFGPNGGTQDEAAWLEPRLVK